MQPLAYSYHTLKKRVTHDINLKRGSGSMDKCPLVQEPRSALPKLERGN